MFEFTAPPGVYEVEVVQIGPSGNDKRPFLIRRHLKKIEIKETPGPGPGPNPGPGPTPPGPNLPDGKFSGFPKKVYDLAIARAPPVNRPALAAALANAVAGVRSAVVAGAYNNVPFDQSVETQLDAQLGAVFGAIREASKAALGDAGPGWRQFSADLATEITSLYTAGRFPSLSEMSDLLGELEIALKAVRS
jgi:hypothetical protein